MQIEATIQDNGDLKIEQTLKYVFNGEYNGIYITIPTKYKNQEEIISKISNNIYKYKWCSYTRCICYRRF